MTRKRQKQEISQDDDGRQHDGRTWLLCYLVARLGFDSRELEAWKVAASVVAVSERVRFVQ